MGPFVLDAHRAVHGFVGKDGVEPASALFVWNQLDDGSSFDTSVRYAFSYDIVQATYPAIAVNLAGSELADYDLMVKNHWSKFVRGYAFRDAQGTYDDESNPQNAAAMAGFANMPRKPTQPQKIYFAFGWDDHTADAQLHQQRLWRRSLATEPRGADHQQRHLHRADHHSHRSRLLGHTAPRGRTAALRSHRRLDALRPTSLTNPFFINDLTQQPLSHRLRWRDAPLPDRGPFMTGNGLQPFASNQGNPNQVIMNTSGINNFPNLYPDFMAFSAQSQAHLNAQGLCYVMGQHASDPYYVPNVQPATP